MSLYNQLENKAKQESQTTEAFFANLTEKIEKSRWFSCDVQANCEIYRLDKIDISFDIRKIYLVVMNKMGIETKKMDCRDSEKSVAQQKKHDLFCELLSAARTKNFAENAKRNQEQQHSRKRCEVESIRNELKASVKQVKRHKLGIRALMRQSMTRAFRGKGL